MGKTFLIFCFILIGLQSQAKDIKKIRLGYFSNITQAQALIGVGEGRFQKSLGSEYELEPFIFNAGPSAVEALLSGSVDLIYVGPNPAINAWIKTKGFVKIIAGAASGGARLIIREGSGIKKNEDFLGKKIATPQFGNTQDVAARTWLKRNLKGGEAQALPIKNSDQLGLFLKGEIDAAWAVEPWASRLVMEAKGKSFLDERELWPDGKFTTALLLTTEKYLLEHKEVLRRILSEHIELTQWLQKKPNEAKIKINEQLKKLTHVSLSTSVLDEAFSYIDFDVNPYPETLKKSAQEAFELGFLGKKVPQLEGIVDVRLLNEILKEKKGEKK